MNIPTKTSTSGVQIPTLGFGTWRMGGGHQRDPDTDVPRVQRALRYAIDSGMHLIDTAELYGMGYTEEILGTVLPHYDREDLFITSKVMGELASYEGIHTAIDKTLARLGTDYVDLYLIHWRKQEIPIEEQMKALDELVDAGKVRNIGVSNFSLQSLKTAQECARNPIILNQVHYNVVYRECERTGLLSYCQENGIILQAWRPLEKGILPSTHPQILTDMMQKYDKTASQILINWLISQPLVTTLFMSHEPSHIDENLGALGWSMDPDDIELLRSDYPDQQDVSNAVPLG